MEIVEINNKKWKLNKYKQGKSEFYNYRVIKLKSGEYIPCILIKSPNKVKSLIDSKEYITNFCNDIQSVYLVCDII